MRDPGAVTTGRARDGRHRPAARLPAALAACAVAAVLAVLPASPALGWGDRGHVLITEEAVDRLPEPLRGLLAGGDRLERLRQAATAPDKRAKRDTRLYDPAERSKHFLDIDAVTDEPPPFATFPHDRAEAEKRFGAETFAKEGSVPWAAAGALDALADALTHGRTDDIFASAGNLAHYAADLHMPFHLTKNYNGQLTGNLGVHTALEVGLISRYLDAFYRPEIRKGRYDVPLVENTGDRLFVWLAEAYVRIKPILEADTAARQKTGYNPADHKEDLDDLASARAKPYYEALKQELEARGSPEAQALRDAAGHLAELLYTAWVRAGKPVALAPPPPQPAAESFSQVWMVLLVAAMLLLILWPRRPAR